jgi:hypothetical protein
MRALQRGVALDAVELPKKEWNNVLATRALGLWSILWMLVVPLWVQEQWMAPSRRTPSVATFFGLVFGFFIVMPLSLAVQAALTRPFSWALRRFFGIDVPFHSRRFW